MKQIHSIEFPGIDHIKDNPDFYKELLIKESAFVFKNANLSYEQQLDVHHALGKAIGWYDFPQGGATGSYKENHSHNKSINIAGPDDILVDWHIEHPYYKNPTVSATWNMQTFNTDNENGKTYFVDTGDVYDLMPKEWQDFLYSVYVNMYIKEVEKTFKFKAVKLHWLNYRPTIRVPLRMRLYEEKAINFSICDTTCGGDIYNPASPEDHTKIMEIIMWVDNEIKNNTSIRKYHKWSQGDLVVSDLFKLAHAVTGGFDPKDRQFIGIWGWQQELPNHIDPVGYN